MDINRKKSIIRSNELDEIAIDDIAHMSKVRTGFSEFSQKIYNDTKNKILKELDATEDDWKNPKWQLKNRISTVDEISKYTDLSKKEYDEMELLKLTKAELATDNYYVIEIE